jgi:integrase
VELVREQMVESAGCEYVFCAPTGGPLRDDGFRVRFWNPAVKTAGFDGLRFHDLRHTHAAILIAQGVHLEVIKQRLGHSSIRVTSDRYGHLQPGLDAQIPDQYA